MSSDSQYLLASTGMVRISDQPVLRMCLALNGLPPIFLLMSLTLLSHGSSGEVPPLLTGLSPGLAPCNVSSISSVSGNVYTRGCCLLPLPVVERHRHLLLVDVIPRQAV